MGISIGNLVPFMVKSNLIFHTLTHSLHFEQLEHASQQIV